MIIAPTIGLVTLRGGLMLVRRTALALAFAALYIAYLASRVLSADPGQAIDRSDLL
jgi:hypothetical protein